MNVYTIFLTLHITGSILLAALTLTSVVASWKHISHWYRPLASHIGWGSVFQMLTGSGLALLSHTDISVGAFCARMSIYLTAIVLTECLLFYRMQKHAFPVRLVTSSVCMSAVVIIFTILRLTTR